MIFIIVLAAAAFVLLFYAKINFWLLLILTVAGSIILYLYLKRHHHEHNGFLSIDFYAQYSRLNPCPPELKLLIAMLAITACLVSNSWAVCGFVLASMSLATVWWGKIPLFYYFALLLLPAGFIVLSSLAILIQFSNNPTGYLDFHIFGAYLSITSASQNTALMVTAKAFSAVSCLYMLSLSTPIYELIGVLRRCRMPHIIIELMYLIYRYIFILLNLHNNMSRALESRLGYTTKKNTLRSCTLCASSLLRLSFQEASANYNAMESRCYEGNLRFMEPQKRLKPSEIITAVIYVIILTIICITQGSFKI